MAERIVSMHAAHRSGKEATVFCRVLAGGKRWQPFNAMLFGMDEWLKKVWA